MRLLRRFFEAYHEDLEGQGLSDSLGGMAALIEDLTRAAGAQIQLSSPLGRVMRRLGVLTTKGHVSLLKSAGGQLQLSSPLGRLLMKASVALDAGTSNISHNLTGLRATGGQLQLSSPVGHALQHIPASPA